MIVWTLFAQLLTAASDIANILRNNAINSSNVDVWLKSINERESRFEAYYNRYEKMIRENIYF